MEKQSIKNRIEDKIAEIEAFIEDIYNLIPANIDIEDYKKDLTTKAVCERYFEKIIDLAAEFDNLIKTDLCVIGDSFWQNENTLFITEDSNFGVNQKFFKISFVEK